jgi:hypothetical protein
MFGQRPSFVLHSSGHHPVLLYARDNYDFSDSAISKLNAGKQENVVPLSQKPEEPANTIATSVHPSGDEGKKSH